MRSRDSGASAARIAAQPQAASSKPHGKVTFARDIAPIFNKSCNSCHGSDKPQGGLRLDSGAAALKGGESGKVIVPGDSEKSPLVRRLIGNGEEARMPMGADPLPANQIKLIRAWIDQNSFVVAPELAAPAASIERVAGHSQQDEPGVFASKIRPILAARCYSCHGPDLQQNGLRLDSLAAVLKGSANGSVVNPGDGDKSPLVRHILGLDRPRMPYGAPPLPADDVELIRKWVDEGARALTPPRHSPPPSRSSIGRMSSLRGPMSRKSGIASGPGIQSITSYWPNSKKRALGLHPKPARKC